MILRVASIFRFEIGGDPSFCVLREICVDISQFVPRYRVADKNARRDKMLNELYAVCMQDDASVL